MPPQEAIAFAAPGTEEMTATLTGVAGAGVAGAVEGVIVKVAPQVGAAAPILTWGSLLGIPLIGIGGALFTRGMLGDLFQGIACGGIGVLGYSLPEFLAPIAGKKGPGGGQLTPEQIAALAAARVKELPAGPAGALARAQAAARSVMEF